MSTRSNIGILNVDGTVTGVYCHNDGYPEHQAPRLRHYNTEEKVIELISYGSMSVLGSSIGEKHDFGRRGEDDICTFYHRDRGEPLCNLYSKSADDFGGEDYTYLFRDDAWFVKRDGNQWIPLDEAAPPAADDVKVA